MSQEEVHKIIQRVQEEGRLTPNEVLTIEELIKEQNTTIDVLRKENFLLKENLPGSQPQDEEYLRYRKDAQDKITNLEMKLNEMRITVNGLDKKLCQLGMDVVNTEESKTNQLFELNDRWEERIKHLDAQSKQVLEELIKRHCDVKKEYETIIQSLKEQINQKEAEVAWCHLQMKERKKVITKEVLNLKSELTVATMKDQEQLRKRTAEVEKKANKMVKRCLRLQNVYQQKLSSLRKENDSS